MDTVQVTAQLEAASSTVSVTASPAGNGQLLAVASGAFDVTVCAPVAPVRTKWRVGTSGQWNDLEGGECFTVSGPDSANVYLAKGAAQSSAVAVTVTVRTVGTLMAGDADARAVQAEVNQVTGKSAFLVEGVRKNLSPITAMTTVVAGNSIAAQSKHNGSYWSVGGEIGLANLLCESAMVFKRITASTRADSFGVYGYSGQKLSTINSDLEAQLYTPLATAGVVPDLIVGLALTENDISQDESTATIQASIRQFVRDAQARFPGAVLLLCTPRPSFSNNTAGRVAAYQAVRDYILSLDDGVSVFIARLDGYENPAVPAQPLAGYTDASVHPNGKGAMVNARAIAATIQRIANRFKRPYKRTSNNMPLFGSAAASGTNVTGTVPTSFTVGGSANGTYVAQAEAPGVMIAITANSKASEPPNDMNSSNAGAIALSGVTQISPFAQIEIVSGAENIAFIQLEPRIQDGGGNTFQYYIQRQTNDAIPEFRNGDVLTFVRPPAIANSGAISSLTNYIRLWPTLAGGKVEFRILNQGCEIVA